MKELTMYEAKIILAVKGYQESSFEEFNKNEKYIQNIQQFYVCEHNFNNVLKSYRGCRYSLYYFIEGSPGLQVRTWQY